jgi:hypothetical protein
MRISYFVEYSYELVWIFKTAKKSMGGGISSLTDLAVEIYRELPPSSDVSPGEWGQVKYLDYDDPSDFVALGASGLADLRPVPNGNKLRRFWDVLLPRRGGRIKPRVSTLGTIKQGELP